MTNKRRRSAAKGMKVNKDLISTIDVAGQSYQIYLPDKQTDYIQGKIAQALVPYELPMLQDINNRIQPGDHIFDIGANIGNHTLFLAAVAKCNVFAFEPNKNLCDALQQSIDLNHLQNQVRVHQVGVGAKKSQGKFSHHDTANLGAQSITTELEHESQAEFDVIALDDFKRDFPVRVLKIDVEGMELAVLEGAKKLITEDKPLLYIECQTEAQFADIHEWLSSLGYGYWDTFNATPTHLFIHESQATPSKPVERVLYKTVREEYKTLGQIAELQGKLENANSKYKAANENIVVLKERLETANQKYRHITEQIPLHKQALIDKQTQLEELRQRADRQRQDLEKELDASRDNYRAANEQIGELKDKLAAANDKYRNINNQVEQLRQELAGSKQQYKQETQRLAELNRHTEEAHAATRDKLYALEHQSVKQEAALNAAREVQQQAERQRQELQGQLDNSRAECHAANEQIGELKDKLAAANDKYRNINNQVAQLRQELAGSKQQYEQETQRLAELNRHTEEAHAATRNNLDVANEKYRFVTGTEIPALKERLESQTKTARELQEKLSRITKDLALAKDRGIKAEKRIQEIRSSLTFQVGYQIRNARSLSGIIKLPIALWRIYRRSRLRDAQRQQRDNPIIGQGGKLVLPVSGAKTLNKELPLLLDSVSTIEPNRVTDKVPARQLKIACIMDEFTYSSFAPECHLHQLTPKDWKMELEAFQPEQLFVESAWRGKDELWGSKVGHKSEELQGIVDWCQQRNIPTIFWNKEDPVHFETFLNTAKLFDYVFTTDIDCIHRYKAALGHERVYLLPFACQPIVNNPIEKYQRKDAFCFAGAYYVRYPERTRDLEDFVTELPTFRPFEIFDRNFGKDDPNYQFPAVYEPFIVGTLPFAEIDRAYKGYHYAINLNSIKQSQTMFARRVYELLASNTLTISNFSRGLRLLFGDLVLTSDSGKEILRRLNAMQEDTSCRDRLRLAALRKVMQEHTYGERLAYIQSKVTGATPTSSLPSFTVLAPINQLEQINTVVAAVERQQEVVTRLTLLLDKKISLSATKAALGSNADAIKLLCHKDLKKQSLADVVTAGDWFALLLPDDYYGPNYLLDLAIATRYSSASVIGKAAHYRYEKDDITLLNKGETYRPVSSFPARASIVSPEAIAQISAAELLNNAETFCYSLPNQLAVDPYNYCENGDLADEGRVKELVNDLPLNTGMSMSELLAHAETIRPLEEGYDNSPELTADQLVNLFTGKPFQIKRLGDESTEADSFDESTSLTLTKNRKIEMTWDGQVITIVSQLKDGAHEYIYAPVDIPKETLIQPSDDGDDELRFYLDMTPGLNVGVVFLFLDSHKQRISHVIKTPNRNHSVAVPLETAFIRFGLRVYASGSAGISRLILGHRNLEPVALPGRAEHLLVTNHYPSYDDLYRNGFVHSRVRAYRERGVAVDLFRLHKDEPVHWHEFENIDVTTGSQDALRRTIEAGNYKSILVHFLSPEMWDVLKDFIERVKVVVWVHGAEIHPWYRRKFNIETPEQEEIAKLQSEKRMGFWHSVLKPMPENLHMVFVSKYFSEEVMEDLGYRLPDSQYSIIHNPIDTDFFNYVPKDPEQRKKILSIRPFASKQYANDLSVKTILELSTKPFFNELEFRIIGDGHLFDEILEPIKYFKNVTIERRFVTHQEIRDLHKQYGIFLCPTRWDSQGVSRDEAMSSGLVPVTNAIAAIPEFADESCAILALPENVLQMSEGIGKLIAEPELFENLSRNAAKRAKKQENKKDIILQEIKLFGKDVFLSSVEKFVEQLSKTDLTKDKKKQIYFELCKQLAIEIRYEEALVAADAFVTLGGNPDDLVVNDLFKTVSVFPTKEGIYDDQQNFLRRTKKYIHYPEMVQIETLALCNAECSFCPYSKIKRKGQKMETELFKKIIIDLKQIPNDHFFTISLNHINEPLLDKRLPEFIGMIESELPQASVTIISNGLLLNRPNIEMLTRSRCVTSIQVSLNDIEETLHSKRMRMGDKFVLVKDNLDVLHRFCEERKDISLKVYLRRVGDDTDNDAHFVEFCKNRWPKFSATSRVLKDFLGQVDLSELESAHQASKERPVPIVGCTQWFHLVIAADGTVVRCCFDGDAHWPIGDVTRENLLDIYQSTEMLRLRQECMTRLEGPMPCRTCGVHWGEGLGSEAVNYAGK